MQPQNKYLFSICICNRNMANTLEKSLISIISQVDERFEIIVIDDGSTDSSLEILKSFKSRYSNFRYFTLEIDKSRKLGLTRNFSIEKANGDWVILHLDADDEIGRGILEFVEGVLRVDSFGQKPVLYSGHQIHMGPRDWLLSFGPYRNLYRLEDRDLYQRLIPNNEWRIISHKKFIHRLKRDRKTVFRKTLKDAFEHLVSDTRYGANLPDVVYIELARKFTGKFLLKIYRLILLPFAFAKGRKLGKISMENGDFSEQGVRRFREANTRTVEEWCLHLSALQ